MKKIRVYINGVHTYTDTLSRTNAEAVQYAFDSGRAKHGDKVTAKTDRYINQPEAFGGIYLRI